MTQFVPLGSARLSIDDQPDAQMYANDGEFTKGVRAGVYGMGSSLRNAFGATADAFDFNDFAQKQYGEADQLAQRAGRSGPRVSSLSQIADGGYKLRDMGDYAMGVMGGALPSMAVGLGASALSGGALLPSLAAGTLAYTPMEMGDAVAKYRAANPGQRIDGETAARLGLTGLASAGAQSIVPGVVGAKIAGKGVASAPARTLRQALAHNAGEIPMEGLTEGAGELIKQKGATPDAPTDWGQVGENAVAGMIGGVPMAGIGAGADFARGNAQKVSDFADSAAKAVTSRLDKAQTAVEGSKTAAKEGFGDAWTALSNLGESAWKGFKDSDLGASGTDRVAKMRQRAADILADPDVPAEWKAKVEASAKGMGNAVNAGWVAAVDKARGAAQKVREDGVVKATADGFRNVVDKVIDGGYLGNQKEIAEGSDEQVRSKLDENVQKSTSAAKAFGEDLLRRVGVDENTQNEVRAAMGDLGQDVNRRAVAAKWKLYDAKDKIVSKFQDLGERFQRGYNNQRNADEEAVPESKKSEDYSGVRAAIGQALRPHMAKINEAIGNDPKALATVADSMRLYIESVTDSKGATDEVDRGFARMKLVDALGDNASEIMADVAEAVGLGSNRQNAEKVFEELSAVQDMQRSHGDLVKMMQRAAPKGEQADVYADIERVVRWATGADVQGKDATQAEIKFRNQKIEADLQKKYGAKAKAIMTQVEKMMAPKTELGVNEHEDGLETKDGSQVEERQVVGSGAGRTLVVNPDVHAAQNPEFAGKGTAAELIKKLQAENPDADVRFVSIVDDPSILDRVSAEKTKITKKAKELEKQFPGAENSERRTKELEAFREARVNELKAEGKGMIQVARLPNGKLSRDEVAAMRMDTDSYGKKDHPSRIEIKGEDGETAHIFDAVAMTKTMMKRINREREWTAGDDINALTRMGRAFSDAVAALTEEFGRFKVTPDLVVGTINDKPITAAEALKADKRTAKDKKDDSKTQALVAATQDVDAISKELEQAKKGNDKDAIRQLTSELAAARREVMALQRGKESRVANDHAAKTIEDLTDSLRAINDRLQKEESIAVRRGLEKERDFLEGRLDDELERSNAERSLTDQAREDADPDGNISVAGQRLPAKKLEARQNMDGSTKSAPSAYPPNAKPLIPMAARVREAGGIGETIANRIIKLAQNFAAMSDADQRRLLAVQDASKPSDVGPLVNELAKRYGGAVVAPGKKGLPDLVVSKPKPKTQEGTPDPKAVAAKKAAFLGRAASGDKALIKELQTSTDLKGLQRAVAALNEADTAPEVVQTINDRIRELVKDEGQAYHAQTRKYSLLSTQVHSDLGREGFAATHDSPHRHEGKFDWRTHQGKGEGNAAFGAGTYLSTADGVHRSYKNQFSGGHAATEYLQRALKEANEQFSGISPKPTAQDIREYVEENLREYLDGSDGWLDIDIRDALQELKNMSDAQLLSGPSPTYEVSVNIKPEQLLDWDAPLSEQSELVKKALTKAVKGTEKFRDATKNLKLQQSLGAHGYRLMGAAWTFNKDGTITTKTGMGPSASVAQFSGLEEAMVGTISGGDAYAALAHELHRKADAAATSFKEVGEINRQTLASDYLQSLGILGHKYAASGGKNDAHPNYVIYDDSKITTNYVHFSHEKIGTGEYPSVGPSEPLSAKGIREYLHKVLGDTVQVAFANIMHAGDFTREQAEDVIRISVHALNPMTVAYHESLHAFFQQLKDKGLPDVVNAVNQGLNAPHIMRQLRERLKDSPEALAQLSDPEERAAYAFQFWASDPTFKLTAAPRNVFEKVAAAIRKVLGVWSNDERALEIFKYFHSGKYQQQTASKLAIHTATMRAGRNSTVDTASHLVEPIRKLGDALVGAGGERMRDTGIPALVQMANLIKRKGTETGRDAGFLPASRLARTEHMNWLAEALEGYSPEHLAEALEAMQEGVKAKSTEAKVVQLIVQKKYLRERMFDDYLPKNGVVLGDLGPEYFPRVWDPATITKNQEAFVEMLTSYGVKNPDTIVSKIVSGAGTEWDFENGQIEIERPGFSSANKRKLDFISGTDALPFLQKDFWQTMDRYTTQATRRGEWSRRFGYKNEKFDAMLGKAIEQGATPEDLKLARDYAMAVDGTLGDDIDPSFRMLQGNLIVYQNLRLLPMAIFSSIVDPLGIVVRGGTVRDSWSTFTRGMKELRKSWQKEPSFDADTAMAEQIGTIENAMLQHTISSQYGQGMMGNSARKVNDLFFRFNLMEGFNRSMRVGATQAALGFIGRHAKGANEHSARYLAELGLTPKDVKFDAEGKVVIDDRMKVAVNRWVDGAVLRPDAADTPIWMHDPHWALFAHLKQFAFAFHHTFLKRVWHEYQHGNYKPLMALGSFVPVMMAADFVKDMLANGGDEPEWKKGWSFMDHVGYGVERAGILGVGQFALDGLGDIRNGGTGLGAVSGPAIDQMLDAVQVLGGRREFSSFALRSMPANSLYRGYMGGGSEPLEFDGEERT